MHSSGLLLYATLNDSRRVRKQNLSARAGRVELLQSEKEVDKYEWQEKRMNWSAGCVRFVLRVSYKAYD